MSASPQPSTEDFAFSAPVVKGAEVTFGVFIATGLVHLRASHALAVDFARTLAHACGFQLVAKSADELANDSAPHLRLGWGRVIKLADRVRYEAALADYDAGEESLKVVAHRHGVARSTLENFRCRERKKAKDARRAPIPKPSGKIL